MAKPASPVSYIHSARDKSQPHQVMVQISFPHRGLAEVGVAQVRSQQRASASPVPELVTYAPRMVQFVICNSST